MLKDQIPALAARLDTCQLIQLDMLHLTPLRQLGGGHSDHLSGIINMHAYMTLGGIHTCMHNYGTTYIFTGWCAVQQWQGPRQGNWGRLKMGKWQVLCCTPT